KEDPVSAAAGVALRVRAGDTVAAGQVVAELHADDPVRIPAAHAALADAFTVGDTPAAAAPRVRERVA
ncbi:MAG: thymidine phosphorylase, partial [Actinomycetota bacterium]